MIAFNLATVLSLLTSLVIPGVSALLAGGKVPNNVAGFLTPLLSIASGFCAAWANDVHGYDWRAGLVTGLLNYGIAVASHFGMWRGTGIEARLLALFNRPAA